MKILINDLLQHSDLPDDLKTPSLASRYENDGELTVNFSIPEDYSTFNIYDGVLSQPFMYNYPGVLSQPLSMVFTVTDSFISTALGVQDNKFDIANYSGDGDGVAGMCPAYYNLLRDATDITHIINQDLQNGKFTIEHIGGLTDGSFEIPSSSLIPNQSYDMHLKSSEPLYQVQIQKYGEVQDVFYPGVDTIINITIPDTSNDWDLLVFFVPDYTLTNNIDMEITIVPVGYPKVQEWLGSPQLTATLDSDIDSIDFVLSDIVNIGQDTILTMADILIVTMLDDTITFNLDGELYTGVYTDLIFKVKTNGTSTYLYINGILVLTNNNPTSTLLTEFNSTPLNTSFNVTSLETKKNTTNGNIVDGILSQPLTVSGSNELNCIGIGGTDATQVIINDTIIINSTDGKAFKDGLYDLYQTITATQITISHNGSYMGRIALGECREMCISPSREPGFFSSVTPRRSLSGQVIPTAGGYGGQLIGVDFRYKIDKDIIEDFRRAYVTQVMQGFPFFIDFNNDDWLPINKFYGSTDNSIIFQSSINGFKYSKRFEFKQAF